MVPESASAEAKTHTVTVEVNGQPVTFETHKSTGGAIKATAIAQGVQIQANFSLFEVKDDGSLKPIADDKEVALHPKQKFRAVTPDDNS